MKSGKSSKRKESKHDKRDVVVLGAARSAIGGFGGSLADIEPAELAGSVMKAAVERSGVDPKLINYVTVDNTVPTDSRFAYVARVAAIQAGLPMESVATSVNRLCSSGLQGIVTTAQNILLGDADYGVGGGVEVMSRGGYLSPAMRSGARMGDSKLVDIMVATLTDPFGVGHMGITAENLAAKWGITREEQDALAAESHRRAAAAIAEGRFRSQIVPIVRKTKKGEVTFDTDEHVKPGTTVEALAKMKPAFKKEGGSVTAGNASGINDGAAFFVLADAAVAEAAGHKPLARLASYAVAGVPNEVMGEGPIPATRLALKKGGFTLACVGADRRRKAEAGLGELRLRRHRLIAAPVGLAAQESCSDRHPARALQGQRPGPAGPDGRLGGLHSRHRIAGSGEKRQSQGARACFREARSCLPDISTFRGLGYKDMVASAWYGILAPVKLPKAIQDKLNLEINAVLADADTRWQMEQNLGGIVPEAKSSARFGDFMKTELGRYAEIVRLSGAKAE